MARYSSYCTYIRCIKVVIKLCSRSWGLTFLSITFATESTLAIGLINVLTPDVKRLLPSCLTSRSVLGHSPSFSHTRYKRHKQVDCFTVIKNIDIVNTCLCFFLQSHQRQHNKDKPYKCPNCYRAYSDSASLQIHLSAHAIKNAKAYCCSMCGRAYTSVSKPHVMCLSPSSVSDFPSKTVIRWWPLMILWLTWPEFSLVSCLWYLTIRRILAPVQTHRKEVDSFCLFFINETHRLLQS